MGPYYKVEIEVLSDTVLIKKGYSLLGHTINLDTEGAEVEFIKAIYVKHMKKTAESYASFIDEFSKINLFECDQNVKVEGEKREVYWNLKITTILNDNMNVEGKNYLSNHWNKVIELMSDFVEDDIRSLRELITVIEYYYPNRLKKIRWCVYFMMIKTLVCT